MNKKTKLAFGGLSTLAALTCSPGCDTYPFLPFSKECKTVEESPHREYGLSNSIEITVLEDGKVEFGEPRQQNFLFNPHTNPDGDEYQLQLIDRSEGNVYAQSFSPKTNTTTLFFPSLIVNKTLRIVPKDDCTKFYDIDVEDVSIRY